MLSQLQTRVAEVPEIIERSDNALKVSGDVYPDWGYGAAVALCRAPSWRRGIERKLESVQSTFAMLGGEAQTARAESLELAVVLLIVTEQSWC